MPTLLTKSWLVAIALVAVSLSSGVVSAQTGEPDAYKVTVKKVELSTDSGSTWSKTLGTKTQEFDIAAASVNSAIGNYLTGTPALTPNTTYNAVRVTISSTFKLKGELTSGVTTFVTTAAGGTATSGSAAEGSFTISECNNLPSGTNAVSGGQCLDERVGSLTTDGGGNMTFTVCFDVSEGLELDGSDLKPGNPTITYTSGSC